MAERRTHASFVQDVQAGFVALIDGLAREKPAVLVFEDAHELRPPMLELIERLGSPAREGHRKALVLALARTTLLDERPAWGTTTANAVRLRLEPLSSDESVDLARQASGRRIEDAEAAEIAERAGGNPFFIIETTGMLLPDGSDGGSSAARPSLPPTVQAVVAARLDHLDPRLRELTRRASSFFVSFDMHELRTIDPEATADEIRQLEEAEILVPEDDTRPVARWRVRHATLKEVAYASLPKRERVRLHQLIAERLAETGHRSWAADHLELAAIASLDLDRDDRSVAERAAEALLDAGDHARRRMESRTAVDYYERTLALAGPEERWGVREARALAGIGEARYWLGEYPAATEVLGRAVELGREVDDPFTLSLALRFLGDIAINVEADLDKAEKLLDESLAAAEAMDEPWACTRTLLFAGWVPWTRGDHEAAEKIWRRALEVADPEDGWARVRALNSLSINMTGGPGRLRRVARGRTATGARAERRGERARRGDRRPVLDRDDHGATGPDPGRPGQVRGVAPVLRPRDRRVRGPGRPVGARRRDRRARHRQARARPPGRGRGGPPQGDPHLRGARRAPARELDLASARQGLGTPRRQGGGRATAAALTRGGGAGAAVGGVSARSGRSRCRT